MDNRQKTAGSNRSGLKRSIQGKLLAYFMALALIPMISLSVLAYFQGQQSLHNRITDEMDRMIQI